MPCASVFLWQMKAADKWPDRYLRPYRHRYDIEIRNACVSNSNVIFVVLIPKVLYWLLDEDLPMAENEIIVVNDEI